MLECDRKLVHALVGLVVLHAFMGRNLAHANMIANAKSIADDFMKEFQLNEQED